MEVTRFVCSVRSSVDSAARSIDGCAIYRCLHK